MPGPVKHGSEMGIASLAQALGNAPSAFPMYAPGPAGNMLKWFSTLPPMAQLQVMLAGSSGVGRNAPPGMPLGAEGRTTGMLENMGTLMQAMGLQGGKHELGNRMNKEVTGRLLRGLLAPGDDI